MKKTMFLLAAIAALFLTSCGEEIEENESGKMYEISLAMGGEFDVNSTLTPLNRGDDDPTTIYFINVTRRKQGSAEYWNTYSAGAFDNTSDMKILLESGYEYRFQCGLIEEGADKLWYKLYDGFKKYSFVCVKNVFEANESLYCFSGDIVVDRGGYYVCSFAEVNRYYGELEGYFPSEGGVATINLVRANWGLNVALNAPSDGSYYISAEMIDSGSDWVSQQVFGYLITAGDADYKSGDKIFSFYNVHSCYDSVKQGKSYSGELAISIQWTRGNGMVYYYNTEAPVERNKITMLNISVNGESDASSAISFTRDDVDFGTQSYNISVEGGELTNNEVNPQK